MTRGETRKMEINSGEAVGGGYTFFRFKVELNKRSYFKDFGRGRRRIEEVILV